MTFLHLLLRTEAPSCKRWIAPPVDFLVGDNPALFRWPWRGTPAPATVRVTTLQGDDGSPGLL